MNDRHRLRPRRHPLCEKCRQRVHLGQLGRLRTLPPFRPPAYLPRNEPFRLTKTGERAVADVDGMQIDEPIDECLTHQAPPFWMVGQSQRLLAAHDNAATPLHDVEDRADDGWVLA
jgi:hypothetical protein